jgi:DNA-binding HxlR family transcriptional regulator
MTIHSKEVHAPPSRSSQAQWGSEHWGHLHQLTRLLGGEWVPAILATLAAGPRHFTEILTTINETGEGQPDPDRHLHDSILGRTLRRMEDNGLVVRHEIASTFPKSTTYEITPWTAATLTALTPAVQQVGSCHDRRTGPGVG